MTKTLSKLKSSSNRVELVSHGTLTPLFCGDQKTNMKSSICKWRSIYLLPNVADQVQQVNLKNWSLRASLPSFSYPEDIPQHASQTLIGLRLFETIPFKRKVITN
jgi:hypothetical protein